MPRPRKRRRVGCLPRVTNFQPVGLGEQVQVEVITFDEIEALRLKDLYGLDQDSCALEMGVAQSTFQRILTTARRKLSRAILEGKAIHIEGGDYKLVPHKVECNDCGFGWINDSRPDPSKQHSCPRCGGKGLRGRKRGNWEE